MQIKLPLPIKKYSTKAQIMIVLIFSVLNFFCAIISMQIFVLPLFLDMIFVYAASFFSFAAGLMTAILFHVISSLVFPESIINLSYLVCSITGVFLVQYFCLRNKELTNMKLLNLIIFSTIIMSLEGAVIYTLLFKSFDMNNLRATVFLTYQMVLQGIPLFAAAFMARLPMNLADRFISVVLATLIYIFVSSILKPRNETNENGESEK